MIDVSSAYRKQPRRLGQGAAALAVLAITLTGCGRQVNSSIDFYHDLEGGHIAQQRPPPPGADDPYPKIGTTPARPLATDIAAEQRIADSLAAQRDAATTAAAQNPVKPLPAAPALPKPPAPDPDGNKVVVDAAPSPPPPAPAAKPRPAPAPGPTAIIADDAAPGIGSVPALATPIAAAALPALPDAPPPVPTGLEIAMPMPPPDAPITAQTVAAPANGVSIAFTPGSSALPPSAALNIRRFAIAHRGVGIIITGHGDATGRDAENQSRALDLGLKRAKSIAESFGSNGVAAGRIRFAADARPGVSTATLN